MCGREKERERERERGRERGKKRRRERGRQKQNGKKEVSKGDEIVITSSFYPQSFTTPTFPSLTATNEL